MLIEEGKESLWRAKKNRGKHRGETFHLPGIDPILPDLGIAEEC